jgi:hypothetical protein
MKPSNNLKQNVHNKQWLKAIEFAVVGVATWLNPEAGVLIFLLKLCFLILQTLQENKES